MQSDVQRTNRDTTGKMLLLGIQHVFAMFGSTVLVPALTGLNPAVALLCAGLGTLLFHLVTKRKVPTFLGSSFAFIAAIVGCAQMMSNGAEKGTEAYLAAMPYATGGIIVAGALYVILAVIVYFVGAERVKSFFPPVVTGPMVIIIGLMLAPTAITNITTTVGLITILSIIGITLFARGFFKLVPILIGIVVGYIAALCFGMVNFQPVAQAQWLALPQCFLPKFDWRAIVLIAPLAIVTFVEHIGDITANSAVVGKDFIKDPGLHRTLLGDGLATMLAGAIGGPANTTYSENTGVLAATHNYNPVTLEIAAVFAILLAFIGKLGAVLQTIPGPVMGGVSVILFGMIAAVGLRTLVENKVDFKESRNLLIVAVMMVFGLGGATLDLGPIAFSGTALAAVLGIILNKALPQKIEEDEA